MRICVRVCECVRGANLGAIVGMGGSVVEGCTPNGPLASVHEIRPRLAGEVAVGHGVLREARRADEHCHQSAGGFWTVRARLGSIGPEPRRRPWLAQASLAAGSSLASLGATAFSGETCALGWACRQTDLGLTGFIAPFSLGGGR